MGAFTDYENGCYVDCNHFSADYLSERIIDFSRAFGFKGEVNREQDGRFVEIIDDQHYSECLNACADEAVDYLNGLLDDGRYWLIDDNSLFLISEEENDAL